MPRNRVYIASKADSMEEKVRELADELERRGYVVVYDWTRAMIPKPYTAYPRESNKAAKDMLMSVMHCDIVIVLCTEKGGVGYHIETGAALIAGIAVELISGALSKRIYAVGQGNDRSLFHVNEYVTRLPDIQSLLAELPPVP